MPATERLMVAALVNPLEPGSRVEKLPPHMTIYPWFDVLESRWPEFDQAMQDVIEQTSAPTTIGGDADIFDGGVAVRRLNRVTPSFNLIRGFDIHAYVYSAVHSLSISQESYPYTGTGWSPHVSDSTERSIGESEVCLFSNLTVIQKSLARKSIKAVYFW